jgi:hypothetical protein
MTTNLYLRLNNLFPSDMDIVNVKKFKRTSTYPAAADTPEKRLAFQKKYKDFDIKGENLFYTPKNLQVVPKIYKKQTLKKEYKKSFGSGSRNFYKTIREKYLNIKRSDVSEFMKTQEIPQLTDNFKHRTNKPIVSQFPNQIWCIDLIEIKTYPKNKGFEYIFSGIDVFSRKIFLEPAKLKDAATISKCLDKIIRRVGVKPKYIICDNGTEFLGEFNVYCEAHEITIRRNRAYSPQANGIVERSNMEIRKLLRDIMLENEDTNWIDQLRRVENLKNDTYTSGIDNIPSKIWNNKNEPIRFEVGQSTDEQMRQLLAKQTILKNVKKQIKEFKDDELDVGDKVRVRMDQISNNIRSLVKDGKTKQVVVVWSPVIFKILKKIVPRKGMLERSRYVVGSVDGTRMLVNTEKGTKPRNFYSNSLKKVEKDEKDSDLSMVDAIRLSGVDLNRNDVYSAPYEE